MPSSLPINSPAYSSFVSPGRLNTITSVNIVPRIYNGPLEQHSNERGTYTELRTRNIPVLTRKVTLLTIEATARKLCSLLKVGTPVVPHFSDIQMN